MVPAWTGRVTAPSTLSAMRRPRRNRLPGEDRRYAQRNLVRAFSLSPYRQTELGSEEFVRTAVAVCDRGDHSTGAQRRALDEQYRVGAGQSGVQAGLATAGGLPSDMLLANYLLGKPRRLGIDEAGFGQRGR